MLTYDDKPTINNAILKRLDKEPGVQIAEIKIQKQPDCIAVGLWILLDGWIDVRCFFDLPPEFGVIQIHNEIDECAEQCKRARSEAGFSQVAWVPGMEKSRHQVNGNGRRGNWDKFN